ncbi:MAG: hypothetical protein CMP24_01270 [Rickettsiales bacterium]|nr:hypothetical protein [Rickettsiales bacterium]
MKNYFYQDLSAHIWAGHSSKLVISAIDDLNQITKIEMKIKIPSKEFINKSAKTVLLIRKEIALRKIDLKKAENSLKFIIKKDSESLKNRVIYKKYEDVLSTFSKLKETPLNYSHILYDDLWQLSLLLEERENFVVKRELEKIEKLFFDSLKRKDTDEIIANTTELKQKIERLIKMRNENNYQDQHLKKSNEELQDRFEELNEEIKDLLNIGSKEKLNEKILQMKELTDTLRNPKKIDKEKMLKQAQKQNLINKLSELLNEQEIIMQESFNLASNRGMFEQSSQGSGGKSPKEKQDSLRNSLGNIMREISSSENEIPQELGRADRAMRQASRDLENGKPDRASNAQGRASEMIQRAMNSMVANLDSKKQDVYRSGNQQDRSTSNPSFTDSKNTTTDGSSSGGTIDVPAKYKEQEAKKIVRELYTRYKNAEKNVKEKKYIRRLLDWY